MPVETPHPDYLAHIDEWTMCRDCVQGSKAVKSKDVLYLPKLLDQVAGEYEAYKKRATFFGAADRTVQGCSGAIVRRQPDIQGIDEDSDFYKMLETIGVGSDSLDIVIKSVLDEVLTTGRCGIFLDAAAEDDASVDPYLSIYFPENITNWRTATVDGEQVLSMVVLKEDYEDIDPKDDFIVRKKVRYRVLQLDLNGPTPEYSVQMYIPKATNASDGSPGAAQPAGTTSGTAMVSGWVPDGDPIIPKQRGGKSLDYIPFVFVSPLHNNPPIRKSPILDLAEMNLSHYRTSADLEHGRHFTSLPTAWAAGFHMQTGSKGLVIGSSVAWTSDEPQARCGYMEFSGAGLASLEKALEEKEEKMAVLGGRLLEAPPKAGAVSSALTVQIRHSGEQSILANIAIAVSEALTTSLQWYAAWISQPPSSIEEINITLNKDYDFSELDPQALAALVAAWQSSAISYDTFFYNAKRGQLYPDGTTVEDEQEQIKNTPPPGMMAGRLVPGAAGGAAPATGGGTPRPRLNVAAGGSPPAQTQNTPPSTKPAT